MKSESSQRARYQRLRLFLVALVIVATTACFILTNSVKHRLITSTGESLALAASDIADKLDAFLFERSSDILILANSEELRATETSKPATLLLTVQSSYHVYEWLALTNANGRIVASTENGDVGADQHEAEWYRKAHDLKTVHIQEVTVPGEGLGDRAVLFAKAVPDRRGQVIGVVAARAVLSPTDPLFEDTIRAFRSLNSANARLTWKILERDGRPLHDSRIGGRPPESKRERRVIDRVGWNERIDPVHNVPVISGYAPIRGKDGLQSLGWSVVVETDRKDALGAIHRALWQISLVGASIILPLFAALWWSTYQMQQDWVRLTSSESYLATTLRSIADGVILANPDGRITLLNSAAETLTGWRENEAKGQHFRDVVRVMHRETRQPMEPLATEVINQHLAIAPGSTVLMVARDGTERIIHQSASPIPGEGGIAGVALICRDVTERELADAAFHASQKTFRLIAENMSDVVTLHDLEGRVLFQSRNQYSELMGLGEPTEHEPFTYILEEDRPTVRECVKQLVLTGEPQRLLYRMQRPGQGIIFVESVGTLVRGTDEMPERIVAVSRDISQRREIEQKLIAEKEFNDTLLGSLPGIFFVCDAERSLLRWNRNFEIVAGHSSEEIEELDLTAFFPLQEHEHVEKCLEQCLLSGKADIETVLWHRNGRLTAYYISCLRFEVNKRPAMLCIGIDISARKAAEEALIATSQRLERQNLALGEQARNPALRGDDLGIAFRTITETASRTLGVSRTSIWFYQRDDAAIHCEDLYDHPRGTHTKGAILREGDFPSYFRALSEGRVIPAHYARSDPRTRESAEIYLKPLGITSLLDAPVRLEGKMIGVICHEHTGSPREWTLDEQNFAGSMADLVALSLEVWQRRQAESALREARDQLEVKVAERTHELSEANERLKELDRLKSEFLATMSHELRTPMNSIIGFTGILRQELAGPLNEEQKKQLGMVNLSAKHLLDLINDLLDLSRIESGKANVSVNDFQVKDVVQEVIQSLQPAATQKGLLLESDMGGAELKMAGDRKRTFQVLLNLANNAVKFTDQGSVKIVVRQEGNNVQFEVIDTGIGIKPEQLANLFQAFRQVDGSAKRVYEGTGLGLYLCKKLVNMLGGSIGAESNFGVGSRFYFTLPAKLPQSNVRNERQDSPRGRQ